MTDKDVFRASQDLDEVIHRCLLNEVFLLLDFISGRTDCTLGGLDGMIDPMRPERTLSSTEALTVLNHIRYPPSGSENDRARDATVLLQAKDRLNILARPATGLSVAYTFMFAGGAPIGRDWRASRLADFARGRLHLGWMFGGASEDPATRTTLAVNAYPGLVASAKRFRAAVFVMMIGAMVVTLFSVWVSYEVALGRSLMLRFDALDKQKTDLSARIYAAEESLAAAGGSKAPRLCATAPMPVVQASVDQQQLCDAYSDWGQKNNLAYRDLRNYAGSRGIRALTPSASAPVQATTQDAKAASADADAQSEQLAASVLTAFSTSILPVLFGLLGAAAAVVRSIYGHVRRRTLTPRELNLSLIRLPLGLVAGVSVGLLFSPDVASVQGAAGLAGGLTLSASSVAFLAGYGVEAVFGMFDGLLKRLFTLESPAPDAPSRLVAETTDRERLARY